MAKIAASVYMELKLLHKILENDRWNANKVTNWGGAPWFYIYVVCKAKQKLHYFLNVLSHFTMGTSMFRTPFLLSLVTNLNMIN